MANGEERKEQTQYGMKGAPPNYYYHILQGTEQNIHTVKPENKERLNSAQPGDSELTQHKSLARQ